MSITNQEFIEKEGRESIQLSQYPVQKYCINTINHRVLSFCIHTFSVTKDLMIGVNSFVIFYIWILVLYQLCCLVSVVEVRKCSQQETF